MKKKVKKYLPYAIALIFIVIGCILQDRINPMMARWIWMLGILIAGLYAFTIPAKNLAARSKITPFSESIDQ